MYNCRHNNFSVADLNPGPCVYSPGAEGSQSVLAIDPVPLYQPARRPAVFMGAAELVGSNFCAVLPVG